MEIRMHQQGDEKIAEVISDSVVIRNPQDALDLMMDPELEGARKIILHREHLAPEFFDLRTGLLGEVVQKFVNYRVQLAVIGNMEDTSQNFQAFMRESNKGAHLFFVKDEEGAKKMLLL